MPHRSWSSPVRGWRVGWGSNPGSGIAGVEWNAGEKAKPNQTRETGPRPFAGKQRGRICGCVLIGVDSLHLACLALHLAALACEKDHHSRFGEIKCCSERKLGVQCPSTVIPWWRSRPRGASAGIQHSESGEMMNGGEGTGPRRS
jgi:hypothetical protein